MENFKPTKYTLQCIATGREFDDTGWILDDPECKTPSLVRANYANKQINLDVQYLSERSFGTDVKILFKTVGAVFGMEGL